MLNWYIAARAEHGSAFIAPTLGALVAPPISYALSYPHTGFTGLVQIRIPTFMALIEDVAVSLATAGFKLGENYGDVDALLGPASNAILVVLFAGYVYRVWTHRDIDPNDVPSEDVAPEDRDRDFTSL